MAETEQESGGLPISNLEFQGTLPDTLSGLLELALTDVREVLANRPDWHINMNMWLDKSDCSVCAAGAVMLQHCDPVAISNLRFTEVCPADFNSDNVCYKLRAINYLREGNLMAALSCLSRERSIDPRHLMGLPPNIDVSDYHIDGPEAWFADMEDLLRKLKSHNL